jgi:hypothetical protein
VVSIKVSNTIETEDGKIEFHGTIEGPELDYVVQAGLNYLMYNKILPIYRKDGTLVPHNPKDVQ